MELDIRETAATRARYDRIAPLCDLMEVPIERLYSGWRQRAWSLVEGPQVLEGGIFKLIVARKGWESS